ncbi:iron-sulfur cluster repair di-iron protein [Taibaiella soli]|uniref:Iron-sulfur cluster repair di-iron protein n=1 Tax=Taibaiella soli TaxID=1649169 RepID=A0A2W2BMS5_9BACT|nr:iron-sulfur cluster repair di-iron protein [Taibaiella soli]PZF74756.1 iron-sulfur cluster repair di-iron protein [Taibaiella soli]
MNISNENIIGAVVAQDYRTAAVFERAGIDFCCNGGRTIGAACEAQKIGSADLIQELEEIVKTSRSGQSTTADYSSFPLDLLADWIEKKHHRYVSMQIPVIQSFLEKIVHVHGAKHPELAEIKAHFDACAMELTAHMKKEELILFPFIRKMVLAKLEGRNEIAVPFGTVQNPIRMMMHEHDVEGERFRSIKSLSNQYVAPADSCNTYKAAFAALQEFEEDLHLHIHLENNILFPKAIVLEESF